MSQGEEEELSPKSKRSEAAKKAWVTRRKKTALELTRRSEAAKKAWKTRRGVKRYIPKVRPPRKTTKRRE